MIKWIGYFRDEVYNVLHKVEITNSDEKDKPRTITPIEGKAKVGRGIYRGVSVRADSSTPTFPFKTEVKGAIYNNRFGYWQVDLDAWVEDEYTFEDINMSFSYECYPEERELILSGESPVVISYEGEDNNIYKPCKYSGCTIKLITDWYDPDLYSKSIFDNKVVISYMTDEELSEYTTLWEGYVTPNAYNQGFAYDIEDLQIECIDSLAALQYKNYEGTGSVVSAGDILGKTLSDFDHLYIQDNNFIGDVEDSDKHFDGYTMLEYLMTDGKAYINTDYCPNDEVYIETTIGANYENIEIASAIFGVYNPVDTNNPMDFGLDILANNTKRNWASLLPSYGSGYWITDQTNIAQPKKLFYGKIRERAGRIIVGEDVNNEFTIIPHIRTTRSLYLFASHGLGTDFRPTDIPIGLAAGTLLGRFTIYEGGVIVKDFYPVKRDNDGMLGMYEEVEGRFFTNANTEGAFVQGSPEGEGSDRTLSELKFTNPLDITKLQLSEYPFYIEDDEEYEKSNILIEEICKFLGYTAIAKGRDLWFLDYSNIKAPFSVYFRDDEGRFKFSNKVTISSHKEWTKDDYFDDGTQFSLNPVYRKVSLENDLSEFSDLTSTLWDDGVIYNLWGKERYTTDKGSMFFDSYQKVAVFENEALSSKDVTVKAYKETGVGGVPSSVGFPGDNKEVFAKYYDGNDSFKAMTEDKLNWGCLLRSSNLSYTVGSIPANSFHAQTMNGENEFIMLSSNEMAQDLPLITFNLNSDSFVQTTKSYYVINFDQTWGTEYFPDPDLSQKTTGNWISGVSHNSDKKVNHSELFAVCRFKYGNLWWDGLKWVDSVSSFNIPLDPGSNEWCDPLNTSYRVNNQVDYHTGLDKEGYLIPIPSGTDANVGSVEFSFMRPNRFTPDCKAVYINGLSIDLSFKKRGNDDVLSEIEETIDETYAEDKELDSCKFGTFDENHLCYNTVGYLENGEYYIVKRVKWRDWICRPEEVRIYKYIIQYSHPRKQVDILLKGRLDLPYRTYENFGFGEIKFIQDSWVEDLKTGTTQLKLVESRL